MFTLIKKPFSPYLRTLLLGTLMLTIPHAQSSNSNKDKSICVFLDGETFVTPYSDWKDKTVQEIKKAALEYFKKQGCFKSLVEYNLQYTKFLLYDIDTVLDNDISYEIDEDDDALQLVLVHTDQADRYERMAEEDSVNHINFKHTPPIKEPVFYIYFERKKLALKVSDFKNKKAKDVIQKYFDEEYMDEEIYPVDSYKIVYKQPSSLAIISIPPTGFTRDVCIENGSLAIVDIDFKANQWNDNLVKEKIRLINFGLTSANETSDDGNDNNDYELKNDSDSSDDNNDNELDYITNQKPVFYVYFNGKKITFEHALFKETTAEDVISECFNILSKNNLSTENYHLIINDPRNDEVVFLEGTNTTKHIIEENDKWAIVTKDVKKWTPNLIKTAYELNNEIALPDDLGDHYITVFFNRKPYPVPQSLAGQNVENIMKYVISKLPSPFNTLIPSRFFLIASAAHNNKFVIKGDKELPLNTISNQWLAVATRTLNQFLNWRLKKNYFHPQSFYDNDLEKLEQTFVLDFDTIKNYSNIYPQCEEKIIANERNPLYGRFYNHLTSERFYDEHGRVQQNDMCHLLEKCASEEYYDIYSRWLDNPVGECPITLMAGLDNVSELLTTKEDEENEDEEKQDIIEITTKQDPKIKLINNLQEGYLDANEFHIIETKDIAAFRTKMYKKYKNHPKRPINPGSLRILCYNKYADVNIINIDPSNITDEDRSQLLYYYKTQAIKLTFPLMLKDDGDINEVNLYTLMSGKTNLDSLKENQGLEAVLPYLQEGKVITLITNDYEGLMKAYIDSVEESIESHSSNYISIAGSLAVVLALFTPLRKKTNTQPVPIAGPKDSIDVIVTASSVT